MSIVHRHDNGDDTVTFTNSETGVSNTVTYAEIERLKVRADTKRAEDNPPTIAGTVLLARLEDAEWMAIQAAANANAQISRWLTIATAQNRINLASAETLAAKAALVAAGLLTEKRADIVFAPPA